MILVDTAVWINHLRGKEKGLVPLLTEDLVLTHSFVIGELSLGHLPKRNQFLGDLRLLPRIKQATDAEVSAWIEKLGLFGKGFGWVDAHLLLSCLLSDVQFWTDDKILSSVAQTNGIQSYLKHH